MTATRRAFCIYFSVGNEMPLFRGEKPCYVWCYICWNFWVENFWATGSAPKRKPPKKRYGIRTPWQYRWKWYARSWKTWDIDHKYVWRVKWRYHSKIAWKQTVFRVPLDHVIKCWIAFTRPFPLTLKIRQAFLPHCLLSSSAIIYR